ncbi:MAG TPA: ATP-binding cassette domain-containing protein [bacterium]|nr:ATP-binding cassette domain-containing protein [bacterium]
MGSFTDIRFQQVSFGYGAMAEPLFTELTLHLTPGWTGIVGANGAGKTTLLQLATGLLAPDRGTVEAPADALYCPQRTDDVPPFFREMLAADDGRARMLCGRLGIQNDWPDRWTSLSHGERKRAQIGAFLWLDPPAVGLDEPTNHIDAQTGDLLIAALRDYRGVALLVSHDRHLLDRLCTQCLFIDPPEVTLIPGDYSSGAALRETERARARRQDDKIKREMRRLKRETTRRRAVADGAKRRVSKRGISAKDRDAKGKIDAARLTGKDAVGGKLLRQMQARTQRIEQQREQLSVKKVFRHGITLAGEQCRRDTLFTLPPGTLALGANKTLRFPALSMQPGERVAWTGPNGAGKSTLIVHLIASLSLPDDKLVYLPQEIDIAASHEIMERLRTLGRDDLGTVMTAIRRLGSDPERILATALPSPGEIRKALIALGLSLSPWLLVLDEPTNHLDLLSIECLEEALAECECGLLLVSHDRRFLMRLTDRQWRFIAAPGGFAVELP